MDVRLDNQTAIVTGGASGIGLGICRGLAEAGANVVIADINEAGAAQACEAIAADFGVRTLAVRTDLTGRASVQAMAQAVMAAFGRIDILVNNAGIAPAYPLAHFPEDKWDLTVDINLKGYFLAAQAIVPHIIAGGRGGSIINMSSKTGVRGSANNSAYSATKWGVIGMGQGWAREFAEHGLRVNAVLPGNVLQGSGIWNEAYKAAQAKKLGIPVEEVEAYYNRQVPLGRSCTVEDVANLVVFLVSDKASYITGCSHLVDGGQEMR